MGNQHGCAVACVVVAAISGCGAGDEGVDPGDLELRDLLGVAPEVATKWDAAQRAAARSVLGARLADDEAVERVPTAEAGRRDDDDARVAASLVADDVRRADDARDARAVIHVRELADGFEVTARAAPITAAALAGGKQSLAEIQISTVWDQHAWGYLAGRDLDVLAALARDARGANASAAGAQPVEIVPASRLPVIAAYVETPPHARMLVNPVMLAALEQAAGESDHDAAAPVALAAVPSATAAEPRPVAPPERVRPADDPDTGNPYSFYGSVGECAAAQQARCTTCLAASDCSAITSSGDGDNECTTFGSGDGSGYYLICINLALAIGSVDTCVASSASGCARDDGAIASLSALTDNADFLTDPCASSLDACLAQIYGAPKATFPGVDGGVSASGPPRDTSVSCSNSCSSSNDANCDLSPSCSGPSGCTGTCDACNNDGGGTSSSGGGGCSGGGGGGTSSSGGDCGGGGDSCGSSSSGGGCSGDGCGSGGGCGGGGGCNNSSGGGNSCGGGGGGGGQCSAARSDASPAAALVVSLLWALMPLPFAAVIRRKKRRGSMTNREVSR